MQLNGHIKTACVHWILHEMQRQLKRKGLYYNGKNVVMGSVNTVIGQWLDAETDFYYLDHSYFQRGWSTNNFRCIRRGLHLTEVKKRPDDRLKKFDVQIEPWRKNRGSKIVVIPLSTYHEQIHRINGWTGTTVEKLRQITDRPISVKVEKGGLRKYLEDAWALVGGGTVAAVEAALMGVPVFVTDKDPAWPVNAGPLENIESPEFPERFEWACSLAYASWNASEIDKVNWIDYDYSLCDDLPS